MYVEVEDSHYGLDSRMCEIGKPDDHDKNLKIRCQSLKISSQTQSPFYMACCEPPSQNPFDVMFHIKHIEFATNNTATVVASTKNYYADGSRWHKVSSNNDFSTANHI